MSKTKTKNPEPIEITDQKLMQSITIGYLEHEIGIYTALNTYMIENFLAGGKPAKEVLEGLRDEIYTKLGHAQKNLKIMLGELHGEQKSKEEKIN
jgi:hypothetical protein